mgnify:CR=1 FL=1
MARFAATMIVAVINRTDPVKGKALRSIFTIAAGHLRL